METKLNKSLRFSSFPSKETDNHLTQIFWSKIYSEELGAVGNGQKLSRAHVGRTFVQAFDQNTVDAVCLNPEPKEHLFAMADLSSSTINKLAKMQYLESCWVIMSSLSVLYALV